MSHPNIQPTLEAAPQLPVTAGDGRLEVLHYTGYENDHSGIHSTIAALQSAGAFQCVLGVNPGYRGTRPLGLPSLALPAVETEKINLQTLWRTRRVAQAVDAWMGRQAGRVVHTHSRAGLLVALWLARKGRRQVVASVHCYGRQRWFYRWAAGQLTGRLYWLSPAMRAHYGVSGAGWTGCVPECVAMGDNSPRTAASGPRLRLVGAGSRVAWKRWDLIVRAMAQLPSPLRLQVCFEHIGSEDTSGRDGNYGRWLREFTQQSGLTEQVRWLPPEPDTYRLLAEADLCVVASKNEPMSLVMLEALAAGVPVLAAASGGAVDVIKPGFNGWHFRDGDVADLARVLVGILESRDDRRLKTEALRLSTFAAADVARQWAMIYRALV